MIREQKWFSEKSRRGEQIDIGRPLQAFPVTPPCVRVRTRRFGWLNNLLCH
jgi:hypothetical protein